MTLFYRTIRLLTLSLFKLFYRLKVVGAEKLPKGAAILAANHASHLDPPLIGVASPEPIHFLARETLFRPPLSFLINRLNAHPVARGEADIASLKTILRLLSEGKKTVIFPEGTRTLDGNLQEMKKGVAMLAMKANCPIVPIYIDGTYAAWPKGQKRPNFKGKITVYFGEPLYPEASPASRKEAQERLTQELGRAIGSLRPR
ncbi:MAG: lysophospholipid acyltransferase family protein [Parachlamydiales bacterium]